MHTIQRRCSGSDWAFERVTRHTFITITINIVMMIIIIIIMFIII